MKFSRILKTLFLIDFLTGLLMAIKETFKKKKHSIILLKKVKLVQEQEVSMH